MVWQVSKVDRIKQEVKQQVDVFELPKDTQQRLRFIVEQITKFSDVKTSEGAIRCVVLIVSALVHHLRYEGLTGPQITRLSTLARKLISTSHPAESAAARKLYGDLFLALSQIESIGGNHFIAAWKQGVGAFASGKEKSGGPGFWSFSTGLRLMRLGHAAKALAHFEVALASGELGANNRTQCVLCLSKAARLSGQLELAQKIQSETFDSDLARSTVIEFSWERMMLNFQRGLGIDAIISAVSRGGLASDIVYLVEAYLLYMGSTDKPNTELFPKIRFLDRRHRGLKKLLGMMHQAALAIESCHDETVPITIRLERVEEVLARLHLLPAVDKELLVIAATLRWVRQQKIQSLEVYLEVEAARRSLLLTDGESADVLGIIYDRG